MKKLILALTTIMSLSMISPVWAGEKEDVDAAFSNWRTALSSGKAENIVALYDKDAVLIATLAAKPIINQEERLKYFTTLTAKPKLAATVTEEYTNILDEDNAVISGLYTFSFDENEKKVEIPARFTFVYEKKNDQWMIIEHHSSQVPVVK